MQTFLPFEDFEESAKVLDRARLGKQRIENLQILNAITFSKAGWSNHPATLMWKGYVATLWQYQLAICNEWSNNRGYRDTCLDKFYVIARDNHDMDSLARPSWLGNEDFHRAHRSNLLRKKPDHYAKYFEDDLPNDLPYIWPTHLEVN